MTIKARFLLSFLWSNNCQPLIPKTRSLWQKMNRNWDASMLWHRCSILSLFFDLLPFPSSEDSCPFKGRVLSLSYSYPEIAKRELDKSLNALLPKCIWLRITYKSRFCWYVTYSDIDDSISPLSLRSNHSLEQQIPGRRHQIYHCKQNKGVANCWS